jgi:hypothetical protein
MLFCKSHKFVSFSKLLLETENMHCRALYLKAAISRKKYNYKKFHNVESFNVHC